MLAAYQKDEAPIKAVVSYYGPVDLVRGYADPPFPNPINTNAVLEAFLGGSPKEFPLLYQQASPISYVRPGLPPTLLVYGGHDHIVEAKYGRSLYQRLHSREYRFFLKKFLGLNTLLMLFIVASVIS